MNKIIFLLNEIRPEFDFSDYTLTDFISDGMLDSFDIMVLVERLDEEFSISIPGVEVIPENFMNLETIVALVKKCGGTI